MENMRSVYGDCFMKIIWLFKWLMKFLKSQRKPGCQNEWFISLTWDCVQEWVPQGKNINWKLEIKEMW